jgi:hypothetical protein
MEALRYKNHENPCDRKSHTFKIRAQIFVLIHQKVYQFKKKDYTVQRCSDALRLKAVRIDRYL